MTRGLAATLAAALAACATSPPPTAIPADVWAPFVAALRVSRDPGVLFGVKVRLAGEADAWLEQPRVEDVAGGQRVIGLVDAGHARGGDVVSVPVDHVVDWLVVCDGLLGGGITLRAERAALEGAARAAFDAELGATFLRTSTALPPCAAR